MKKICSLFLCLMLVLVFVGCQSTVQQAPAEPTQSEQAAEVEAPTAEPEEATESEEVKSYKIAVSLPTKSNQWWTTFARMIELCVEEINLDGKVHVECSIIQNDNAADQVASVETQIIDMPDMMFMAPVDTNTSAAAVDSCYAAGIPVFITTRLCASEHTIGARVYNEKVFAYRQLEVIDKIFPDGAKMVYLFGPNEASYAVEQYKEGFLPELEKYPNLELLETFEDKHDTQDVGFMLADNALAKYGDEIDCFVANNDLLALGAIQALKAAGYEGQIKVFGSASTPQGMVAIREGNMEFTCLKSQALMADMCFDLMLQYLDGETIEEFGYIDPVVITKENVETITDPSFGGTISEPMPFDFDAYKAE